MVAAGRANHAGIGNWNGLTSNSQLGGLEVEHVGTTTAPARRHETSCRILAALIEAPGSPRDAGNVAQHYEYALPRGRKIDFAHLSPWDPHMIRQRTAFWVGRTMQTPVPPPPEEDMPYILGHPNGSGYLVDGGVVTFLDGNTAGRYTDAGITTKTVALNDAATADAIIANGNVGARLAAIEADLEAIRAHLIPATDT